MKCPFLFVYGTLRRNTRIKMASLLDKRAAFISYASYQGKLYKVGNYPGVVPSDRPTDRVQGEVYRLRNPCMLLACLDAYEECGADVPEPTEYVRKIQRVRLQGGKAIPAWIYLYNWPTDTLDLMPSGNSLNSFHKGG